MELARKHPDQPPLSVGLVDDHPMVVSGLAQIIEQLGLLVAFKASSAEEALAAIGSAPPAIVITDLNLPGLSGTGWLAALGTAAPESKILVFTMADDVVSARQALATGVAGYLLKGAAPETIQQSVMGVVEGRMMVDPELPADALSGAETLTPREWEVLRELVRGHRAKEIAAALGISPKTAENHRANISEKLGARHVSELIRFGLNQGLLRGD